VEAREVISDFRRAEMGRGLMEVIVGVLVTLIVGSVLLHFGRRGWAMYQLSSSTWSVADHLQNARKQAVNRQQSITVIFDSRANRFGVDWNGNGRLDNGEAEELSPDVNLTEDASVTFAKSGLLAPGSKQPRIVISNTRDTRRVTVSSLGSIDID
jgi:Tfp pilus assembly protein FimT